MNRLNRTQPLHQRMPDQPISSARAVTAAAVTAAVVGVIANLSVWFALHVLFSRVVDQDLGGLTISVPQIASFDWRAGVLAALAAILIFRLKWNVLRVLGLTALGGLILGHIV